MQGPKIILQPSNDPCFPPILPNTLVKPGLGTAFFPVQNVPVFPVLLKNVSFFPVLFLSFGDLSNPKECSVLSRSYAKNVPFFYKERERKKRLFCSFIKNRKESKDRSVLLKRTGAQPWFQHDFLWWM